MKLISGSSNLSLAIDIAKLLGIKLVEANFQKFIDGEIKIEINEDIRNQDVFVLQSTSAPVNDNLMELLITIDALRRSLVNKITLLVPYFGYARQDRKMSSQTSISAKLVANMITKAGADQILIFDLHNDYIEGFFDIPIENLSALPIFINEIEKNYQLSNLVIVSPDVGGITRAKKLAEKFNLELIVIDKKRSKFNKVEAINIIGDVNNKDCLIIDDIVDSGMTLCNAVEILYKNQARCVNAYITHGVLSMNAIEKIKNSKLNELFITNSIHAANKINSNDKIKIVSIASLIAQAIKRLVVN